MDNTTTEEIEATIAAAERASYAKTGSFGGWVKEYGNPKDNDMTLFRRDFLWLLRTIKEMRAKTFELEYALEAAGVKVPL